MADTYIWNYIIMAVNIVNIGFKGTYPSSTADRTGYVSDLDTNDVFYFLGTNYGTTAWSNPPGTSHLTFTEDLAFGNGDPQEVLFDSNAPTNANDYLSNSSGTPVTMEAHFTTSRVQPTFVQLYFTFNGVTSVNNIRLQASDDGIMWEDISTSTNISYTATNPVIFEFPGLNADKYYEYIRIICTPAASSAQFKEWKLYGNLFRTDAGEASQVTPITTVENLPKFIPEQTGVQDGDLLYYNGGIITNQRNTYYETERITMTGTLALSDNHFPNFYILDPNGAIRTVTLPPTPLASQFFRIKTLDTGFAITIDDGGTVTTLDNSTLVTDLYWDGTEWTAINFG